MAAEHKLVRQTAPGPTCFSVNVFSGRVIAKADAGDEQGAKDAAEAEARTPRDDSVTEDRARACPGNCNNNRRSRNPWKTVEEIATYTADADTPVYVSYWWGGWRVTVQCDNQQQFRALGNSVTHQVLEHAVDRVCPGTRVMSGCCVAMAVHTRSGTAGDKAKERAVEKAQEKLDQHRALTCPAGCAPQLGGDQAPQEKRLGGVHEIKQAKQGTTKKYVAYHAAYWSVEIRCVKQVGKGKRPREEGEYV